MDLLKERNRGKFCNMVFVWTINAMIAFNEIKRLFSTAFMLIHYNSEWRIMLESNALGYAVFKIISQLVLSSRQWHFVAF